MKWQSVEKQWIRQLFLPSVLAALVLTMAFPVCAGDQAQDHWSITVVKAQGLKNKDWGKRKLSDPFVVVRVNGKILAGTHVIQDSLSPTWNQTFTWVRPNAEWGTPFLEFWVYDKDPIGQIFLGKADMGKARQGDFQLRLMRKIAPVPVPGTLTVSIHHVVHEKIAVPQLAGLTKIEAWQALHGKGFRVTRQIVYTQTPTADEGKIYAQNPTGGALVEKGTSLMVLMHEAQRRVMPRVTSMSEKQARNKLQFLLQPPRIRYSHSLADIKHLDKWYRVTQQAPGPGKKITLDAPVTLIVVVPAPGTRVEMPDLKGLKADEASRELGHRHLHFTWQKRESSLEDNGKVIDQQPEAGTRVPFDKPGGVTVFVGHYSDGLSYFSAKPVTAGQTVDLFFKKPKIEQFRRIHVQKTGYLVLRKTSTPFPAKCAFFGPTSPDPLGRGSRYFDGAQRVTPGQWVFSVYPEFDSDTSEQPVKVKVEVIPEFDLAEPNDSFESAALLEPDAHIKIGFIGTDDHDYYRFEVKQPGYLLVRDDEFAKPERTIQQTPMMNLYNAERKTLYSGGTRMAKWLAPGVYFLDFYCERAGENFDTAPYGMDIRMLPDTEKIEPNDTPAQATPVKVPGSLAVRYDTGGQNFYRLSSAAPGYVIVSHPEKLPFAVKLWKTEADGAESRARWLPCAVRIDKTVTVRVDAEHREEYRVQNPIALNFLFIPGTEDPFEPNETLARAHPITVDKDTQALSLPASDVDTYRFRLQQADTVTLEVTDKAEKCVLQARLYDRGGQPVGSNPIYLPEQLKLPAGEYLVQIFQENGLEGLHVSPYRFRVRTESGTPPDERLSERYRAPGKSNESTRNGIELAQQAYLLYQADKYEKAADLYQQAAELIPQVAAVWNDLGASEFNLGHLDACAKAFNKAVILEPDYALAWRNLGVLARKKADHAKSVEYSEKATRLAPTAENLRYAGYACLLAGAAENGSDRKIKLWKKSAAFLEKSLVLEKDPKVQERLKLLKQYLAAQGQGS